MSDWQELRERYGPLVWTTVYRVLGNLDEAQDCFQDVFVEVIERSTPDTVQEWGAYLRWLATRRALNRLKKSRNAVKRLARNEPVSSLASTQPDPERCAEGKELVEVIRQATARLPNRQGEAIWLSCVEQMSYADIAAQMRISVNAVGVLVYRGRQKLREMLVDLNAPAK
jgi:RNA polymerase sigma factor (sigma-70 family)